MRYFMRKERSQGYSLIELCVLLLLLGLLLFYLQHSFQNFYMRLEREATLTELQKAIELAKLSAYLQHKTITVCATLDGKTCVLHNWSKGYLIGLRSQPFRNSGREPSFQVLYSFKALRFGRLHFEQFGHHLNLEPDGTTINVGTFTYCPLGRNRQEAEALVVNKMIRTYRPVARDQNGIRLKNAGTAHPSPLYCQ